MNSTIVKNEAERLGADLCGIAPVERFDQAPPGYHPRDVYRDARSVIVVAKKCPRSVLDATSFVPYTFVVNMTLDEVHRIAYRLVEYLEANGARAVPVPSMPYEYWDEANKEGRGILSLKHAGMLAGLGVLGRNTLLTNKDFGNMISLGAVLVNRDMEPDPIADYQACKEDCGICLRSCPAQALDGITVDQRRCRETSEPEGRFKLLTCNTCRKLCPNVRRIA